LIKRAFFNNLSPVTADIQLFANEAISVSALNSLHKFLAALFFVPT